MAVVIRPGTSTSVDCNSDSPFQGPFSFSNPEFPTNYPPGHNCYYNFEPRIGYSKRLICNNTVIKELPPTATCDFNSIQVNGKKYCPRSPGVFVKNIPEGYLEVKVLSDSSRSSAVGKYNCTVLNFSKPCDCSRKKTVSGYYLLLLLTLFCTVYMIFP